MEIVKFKPCFLVYVFMCVYFGWYNNIFFYITAVVLHEYGHLLVAKFLGYKTKGIVFDLYGAGLMSNNNFIRKDDIVISLAGPFVNLFLILITICCWWIAPKCYVVTYDWVVCNFFVMIFNLLPIYPLDGGRILIALFSKKFRKKNVLNISSGVCVVFGILLFVIFIISCFFVVNFNMLFVGFFLCVNGVLGLKYFRYESLYSIIYKKSKSSDVRLWKVNDFNKVNLLKYTSMDYYSIFVMYSNGKKMFLFEDELYE